MNRIFSLVSKENVILEVSLHAVAKTYLHYKKLTNPKFYKQVSYKYYLCIPTNLLHASDIVYIHMPSFISFLVSLVISSSTSVLGVINPLGFRSKSENHVIRVSYYNNFSFEHIAEVAIEFCNVIYVGRSVPSVS